MGRPSRIYVAVEGDAADITGVKVGGTALLVGRGELLV
jgi:predicted PhzF superfamily epimerase YddE/YHI9